MTSTGHPVGDAVLPAALRLVGAVRAGDPVEVTAAIGAAMVAADSDYWMTALAQPSRLAWNEGGITG